MLEQKIGALDQAAPLVGWDLPVEFVTLRRLIEARMGQARQTRICPGLTAAGGLSPRGRVGRGQRGHRPDAVKHLVLCRIECRPRRLNLTVYPYLPRAKVATTSAKAYLELPADAAS